jgi:polar amino acid transport system substrate-binding protein
MHVLAGLAAMVTVLAAIAAPGPARAGQLQDIISRGEVAVGIALGGEPIGFRDARNEPSGYDVDVARLLADKLGVQLRIVEVTGANRIPMLQSGQIDVIIANITATLERAKAIDFTMPYLRAGIKVLVQRNAGIRTIADLNGRKVVVGRGGTGEQLVRRLAPGAELVYVDSYAPEGILLMRQGRADAALEDNSLIDYTAKQYPDRLVALPELHTSDAICFAVRKGDPDFLRWLDMLISEYIRTGLYSAFYTKWWGTEPAPIAPRW